MHHISELLGVSWLRKAISVVRGLSMILMYLIRAVMSCLWYLAERIIDEIAATEQMFLMMSNLYAFMCQFFFFTLCDISLLKPEHKHKSGKVISGLTTLLLYSIVTYFGSRIRDTFHHQPDRNRSSRSTRDHILNVIKVILEFVKATIVVLCLREQGLQYHFDAVYSSVTFVYYLCTEKLFVEAIVQATRLFNHGFMDGLEHFYVPIVLHVLSILATTGVIGFLLLSGKYVVYALLSSYFTLYLPVKDLLWNYFNPLMLERKTFASFKVANEKDISRWDDICAVCLERMSRARITPCNHLFHPQCLKRCLQTSMQCPLCKNDFLENEG